MLKKAFTILEVTVVLIIIGVLATLGLSNYHPVLERAHDREAKAFLRQIIDAQRIYQLEHANTFYPSTADIGGVINPNLKLRLPTEAGRLWNFSLSTNNLIPITCAQASRNGDDARNWRMTFPGDSEPVAGACP